MQGFFNTNQFKSDTRPGGKIRSCVSCGLSKNSGNPKVKPIGQGNKGILNIFSIPSYIEDNSGNFFNSQKFQKLKRLYKSINIDLFDDCKNIYAIKCHTETATSFNLECCRKSVLNMIEEYKPQIIVTFGIQSLESILGHRWKKGGFGINDISKWNGYCIPDQDLRAFIIPTFEVDFCTDAEKIESTLFKYDLARIDSATTTNFPVYKEPEIIYLNDDLTILNTKKSGYAAFDFETTGLKPHATGHRIVCASVAVNENTVYSFMLPENREKRKPFIDFLQNKAVLKISHNMKYEDTWANVRLKTSVNSWYLDTMQMTHIIDNSPGVSGLKFQTYVQFGVIDYSSHISPYLEAVDSKNSNSLNRILELCSTNEGQKELLKYCAYDSIFEYRLAMKYKYLRSESGKTDLSPIFSDFPNAYALFHNGILALAKAERQGLQIDTDYCEKQKQILTKKINRLEKKFFETEFYKKWQKNYGKINLNSGKQLSSYLYNTLGIEAKKETVSGGGSTDEEALRLLNIPELNLLLERTKLLKLRDTFLEGVYKESVNGVVHPFFNLHLVRTYRSSSDSPNFQNLPKRDYNAMQVIRGAVKPRKGFQLLEMDFSQLEVSIAAAYHKDPVMLDYLKNKKDMHGDMAQEIFCISDFDKHNKYHSTLRKATKNGFVFPQFYGDYYKNCAANICSSWINLPESKWKKGMGISFENTFISDHFIENGIKSFNDFVLHIQKIEKDFWMRRFSVYAAWKELHYQNYLKNGYVSLHTGFVCRGVMSKNDAINYPVQGAAFHCLLWVFIELTNWLEQKNYKTKLVGQIHDAIVIDVYPDELLEVYSKCLYLAEKELPKHFKWINSPMSMEAELCPVDGSWNTKQEWKPDNFSIDDLPF